MILDCREPGSREDAVRRAADVVRAGRLVVLPTDTVYGVGADAFDRVAVAMVLAAKHRSRDMPPPVLVPGPRTVDGLASTVPLYAKMLMRAFWPGALTVVLRAQASLAWDLGQTNGTVALRMPHDPLTLDVLTEVGPMAVTSANVTGQPAATTAPAAQEQLGGAVSLYLDDGPRQDQGASTIVDCTAQEPVVLRAGAVTVEALREVLGDITLHESPPVTVHDEASAHPGAAGAASPPWAVPPRARTGSRLVGTVGPSGVLTRVSARVRLGPIAPEPDIRTPTVGD